jgi:hypothetical protein
MGFFWIGAQTNVLSLFNTLMNIGDPYKVLRRILLMELVNFVFVW